MFTIVQAGSAFKILNTDGTVYTTLVLPTGVTVDPNVRAQFHTIANKLIITGATSINLWVDPMDFTVRPLAVLPPSTPPTIAAGSGTGLTGAYYAAYSYIVQINGIVVQESPLSPISLPVTLADDDVNWTNLVPSTEAHVTGYRLYRTVAGGSPEVMFESQVIGNQIDTSFTGDDIDDAALEILPQPRVGNAPGGTTPGTRLQCCTEWGERLWGVAEDPDLRDKIYYTESGNPFAWHPANFVKAPIVGEDETGVVGFLRRRDELVFGKRRRFCKIIGFNAASFEVIILAEGPGMVARDSCVVIDDVGYCLGDEGVWSVGPDGVVSVSEGKTASWWQTSAAFNPLYRDKAVGGYNWATQSYELFTVAANLDGTVQINIWVTMNKTSREWYGGNRTEAIDVTCRGTRYNANGQLLPVIGEIGRAHV